MNPLKAIKKLFLAIWNFLDKCIILPITKVLLKTNESFGNSGRSFEGWLSKKSTLLFVSLFLAVAAFIAIDQKKVTFSKNSAEVLKPLPVKAIYNEEAYVVDGLPETVDITLIGSNTDLFIAKQLTSYDVTVDLTGLAPGQHKIPIKYKKSLPGLDYMVNPAVVNITISNKISQTKKMSVDILNINSLDHKLFINETRVGSDTVIVKGSDAQLKQVSSVKALLDVKNIPTQEVGEQKIKEVPLKAYDQEGNVIDVEIVPNKIEVDVVITSPSKEIPIKVIPKGTVAFGKAISALDASVSKVMVYGSTDILDKMTSINIEVDINELKSNKEFKIDIKKPVDVSYMSVNSVTVKVVLDSVAERDIENVRVISRNLGTGFTPSAVSAEDGIVTVSVKGVASVIKALKAEDIVAYVDLDGLKTGTHEVEIKIEGNDSRVQFLSKTKKVKIRITKK